MRKTIFTDDNRSNNILNMHTVLSSIVTQKHKFAVCTIKITPDTNSYQYFIRFT